MLTLIIVEDDKDLASLLKDFIESESVKVKNIYGSGEEAVENIDKLTSLPDIILMDIGLPGISGIETTKILKNKYPQLDIIAQTVFEDTSTIIETIKAGASGYILKASAKDEIINALKTVKDGGSFLSGKIAKKVLEEFKLNAKAKTETDLKSFNLTEREEEILKELMLGSSYKGIADKLHISIHTVNNHIRHVYEKMHVNSKGEAVAKATGKGNNS